MSVLKNLSKSVSKLHPIIPISGSGSKIITKTRTYIDFTSGIGALSTGYCHPSINSSVKKQLESGSHFAQQVYLTYPNQLELNKNLLNTFKTENINKFFYTNSGSESTENAIKIAKLYTKKNNIISINKGFHGRTLGALAVTSSNLPCKRGIYSNVSGVHYCEPHIKSLENILTYQSCPTDTSAIILESIQGEGGINILSKKFLKYVEKVCKENNILLIADEVQCGAGRTGHWWNIESKGIEPDIISFGKGIASGFQLAGLATTEEILDYLPTNCLGGTYGGNPISTAAALATINVINEENLLQNVNNCYHLIYKHLDPDIKLKGEGLMLGFDFNKGIDYVDFVVKKFREEYGILVLKAGNNGQYLRILPPLNIDKKDIIYFINSINDLYKKY
jgi:4-aminobutyrate aminotransferase